MRIASEKVEKLPPYLFAEIDRIKKRLIDQGHDVISLGIGDPDQPTPPHIVAAGQQALANSHYHRYPLGQGNLLFRKAIASYYQRYDGVSLDPEEEICVLIGSKEGIAHLPLSLLNPGDVCLVPEPGYPVYHIGTMLAGATSYFLPLTEANNFLPDFSVVPSAVLDRTRLVWLNYPNNPTSVLAPAEYLNEVISFCRKRNIIIAYDAAYHEIYFDSRPVSFLSLPGAKEIGVEFHSLSKSYNMTGWRVGWVCGNREIIKTLGKLKENIDSGTFEALQIAGTVALSGSQTCLEELRACYRRRRDLFASCLESIGWSSRLPQGTFYYWVKVPSGQSVSVVKELLEKAKVVATPGVGFGPSGEGFVRFSLTLPEERLREAIERMVKVWKKK
ncbi:MAG: LL-diaminopimelate aminotransferase [Candidatus Omnitrophica bacterium]|nr:LL-diaminopimelate aminotransferase [Candidatus Omnitrophota bacterium]